MRYLIEVDSDDLKHLEVVWGAGDDDKHIIGAVRDLFGSRDGVLIGEKVRVVQVIRVK